MKSRKAIGFALAGLFLTLTFTLSARAGGDRDDQGFGSSVRSNQPSADLESQPEIHNLGAPIARHQNVGGLDVAMDDALLVRIIQRLGAFEDNLHHLLQWLQMLGAAGYMQDHPMELYYRDAKQLTIVEGTSQVQLGLIAKGVLDHDLWWD